MAAPTGVNAYLSGDGHQVTVDWNPSANGADTLLGYYIYRSCDNQDPVQVNADLLAPTDSSFVDSSTLKPGKIYTYYVVACYSGGGTRYLTMNPKSSMVVWGVPLSPNTGNKYTASIFNDGSLTMVMAMAALGVAIAALGTTMAIKKKKASAKLRDEE